MSQPERPAMSWPPRNRILAALPPASLDAVRPELRAVELRTRTVLYDIDVAIERVYFPETAVASVLALLKDGSAVETSTIGFEGFVGMPVFLGAMQTSAQCFAQVPGTAYEMSVDAFRAFLPRAGAPLQLILHRYAQALMTLIGQAAACNRRHNIRQRCARWLLLTHDRVNSDVFELTQQFLSQMLGVQRTTVRVAAAELERAGCIRYKHGVIEVIDRAGLERESCECYDIIRAEFERLLGFRDVPSVLGERPTSRDGLSLLGDGAPQDARSE